MFYIAHAGHEHSTEPAVQAATTQADNVNYAALSIIVLGLCLVAVGVVLGISTLKKRSKQDS